MVTSPGLPYFLTTEQLCRISSRDLSQIKEKEIMSYFKLNISYEITQILLYLSFVNNRYLSMLIFYNNNICKDRMFN